MSTTQTKKIKLSQDDKETLKILAKIKKQYQEYLKFNEFSKQAIELIQMEEATEPLPSFENSLTINSIKVKKD